MLFSSRAIINPIIVTASADSFMYRGIVVCGMIRGGI